MSVEFKNYQNAAFMSAIEVDIEDIKRLINLVQDNQDFFGDPPPPPARVVSSWRLTNWKS